jgi:uncharacterized protein (DUF849 family)
VDLPTQTPYLPIREIKEFKYDWEEAYALGSKDAVFRNTFEDLEYILKTMKESNVKPELEIYDAGPFTTPRGLSETAFYSLRYIFSSSQAYWVA